MCANIDIQIDPAKSFQFLGCEDHVETCCPHCGADGRYIYTWAEYGRVHSAMAGCYALLTGKIKKDDVTAFIERLATKQAKKKPLNGWDKTVIRMQQYIIDNSGDTGKVSWAEHKIFEAVRDCTRYAASKFH